MSTLEHSSSANYSHLEAAERPRGEHELKLGTPFLVPDSEHTGDYYTVPNSDRKKHYRVMFDTGEVAYDEEGSEMRRLVGGDIEPLLDDLGQQRRDNRGNLVYMLPEKVVYASHLTVDAQKGLAEKYGVSYGELLDTIPEDPRYVAEYLRSVRRDLAQHRMGQAALNETKAA